MSGQKASLHTTQRSVSRIMWGRLFLVFLVGATSAEHFQAWKTDTEYEFNVRSRTLAGLVNEYTGIVLRARLTVRPKSADTLEAKVSKAQYARIHTKLTDGWKTDIPDHKLDLKQLPISEKVFEIKMRHGVVCDLIVDKDVQHWELNVLKSIVSQLQVDTQGENSIASRNNQEPDGDGNNAKFKTMEDSVGGKCEVLYEISNLRKFFAQRSPELVPMPQLRGKGKVIDIVKTKNYSNCEQRMSHHFDMTGSNKWEPRTNDNGKFMYKSSVSRIIITGNLKNFTIQSSTTTNEVIMSPSLHEDRKGMVSSLVNVTLTKMGPVSSGPWSTPAYPASTGNLVYSFGSPIALVGEGPFTVSSCCRFTPDNSEEQPRGYNLKFKRQIGDDDDSSASRSSKNTNSLQIDEDQSYWQPGPTLNDPPSAPLLRFFDRTQVRSVNESEEVDLVAAAKLVASQIGSDLQNPNNITDEQTLEKFTILARLIRTMNTKQIAEVQSEVYQSENEMDPHDAAQSVRSNAWAAFRDAVAQAGTGPALVTIKNWIKEKKVEGPEAASVVGALSQTARTPNPEYMAAFFELAIMPETANQEILNSTAMITFAELVGSQVSHQSTHNRYPVHSFGRLSPEHNPAIFRDYVPYMSEQLKKSINNNEAAKSHVFIRALGNVAHPNILAIFEPYLEGKIPASTFQRTLMVFSMDKLAALRPRLARGVLYRIYKNTAEAHQVRCAAVVFLMTTNPPENMLRRMAKFTNSDHSKQVNAVVKSAIESACELRTPEHQVLAQKARNVSFLLNKEWHGRKYSKSYFWDRPEKMNIAHQSQAYLGSDDSFFPQAFYASMKAMYGDFQAPKLEVAAMVSSVKDLYRELKKQFQPRDKKSKRNHQEIQFSPDNIAKLLKIEDEDEGNLEGVFWTKSKYDNGFMSFDKRSLRQIPELLKKAAASLKEGRIFNMAKLASCDVALSFPMESGFPFVYTMKVPALLKASGSVKGENSPNAVQGSIDLRLVYSMQVQARLGFVTPFGHRHYMAGVNKNLQVYVPIHAEVKYDKSEKQVTLKIQPIEQNEESKIVHYSIVPFVSHYSILDLLPVMKDDQTHKLGPFDVLKELSEYGLRTRGMNFKFETAPAGPFLYRNGWVWDQPEDATFPFAEEYIEASRTELTMTPSPYSEQSVILTGSFQTLQDDATKYDENRGDSSLKGNASKIRSKKINDPERRSGLLREVAEGIPAADAFAIDLGVELPGQEPFTCVMTMAFAKSDVDEKFRGLTYWSCTDGQSQSSTELCVGLEGKGPKSSVILDSDKASSPSRSFDVDIRFGNTCEEGYKVQIHGKQKQTNAFKKAAYEPAMLECMKGINTSMQSVPACMEASALNSTMDKSRVIIKFDPEFGVNRALRRRCWAITDLFPELELRYQDDESIENNTVILSMSLVQTKPEYKANIAIKTTDLWLPAPDADIDQFAALVTNAHGDRSTNYRLNTLSNDDSSEQHMCVVDSKSATTFDKVTYPIELGKCWHVAMTTYPKKNNDDEATDQINQNMQVGVVVRDAEENKKEANLVLGKDQLNFTSDGSSVRVQLNGKTVDFSEESNYRHKNYDGDLDFDIVQGADGSVTLSSSKRHVAVTYDGERVQIAASGKYRNGVRGLCGNYDGEPANDLMSPKNCVLSKPEQFVGSYALTSTECQGQALQNARKANEADCIRHTGRPGDVAGDSEAGRSGSEKNNWGFPNNKNTDDRKLGSRRSHHCTIKRTKVIDEHYQICFSLRPLPTCAPGCKAVYTTAKDKPFYCTRRREAAQKLVDRIKQDSNPDLARKWLSKKMGFDRSVQLPHCVKRQM